jgi:hypothetical protein
MNYILITVHEELFKGTWSEVGKGSVVDPTILSDPDPPAHPLY